MGTQLASDIFGQIAQADLARGERVETSDAPTVLFQRNITGGYAPANILRDLQTEIAVEWFGPAGETASVLLSEVLDTEG